MSVLSSGAECNGLGDDTSALQAWLRVAPPGTVIYVPAGVFCVIDSANLILPANVKLLGVGGFPGSVNAGGDPTGSGFFVNPAYSIYLSNGDILDGIGIWRSRDGHFHIDPTAEQAVSDISQWRDEWSQGLVQPFTGAGQSGIVLREVFIEGFHICLAQYTAHIDIEGLKTDCPTSIAAFGSGDTSYARRVRNEPFYSGRLPASMGAWQRYGASFYLSGGERGDGGGYYWRDLQSEGWPMAFVVESAGNCLLDNLTAEYPAVWANSPPGYPAEQYGVFGHVVGHTGDQGWFSNLSWGSAGSNGVLADGVVIDDNPARTIWNNLNIESVPSRGSAFYASGATAAPTVERITALPAVGSMVSVTIGGSSIVSVGGPFAITYVVQFGDTPVIVAQRLTYLINTQFSALAHAHVNASRWNRAPGEFAVYWPADESVSVSLAGATFESSIGNPDPGSTGAGYSLDLSAANSGALIRLGNTSSGALAWLFSGVWVDNGTRNLPANWLSWSKPPAQLTLAGIQWSKASTTNLNGTGGDGAKVEANSFDNEGVVTEGANATGFSFTFSTPYPAAPTCLVAGGPITSYSVTAKTLSVVNPRASGLSYTYRCDLNVHG